MHNQNNAVPDAGRSRLLSLAEVTARTSLSASTIKRLEGRGEFPRRRKLLGSRRVVWSEAEINEWVDQVTAPGSDLEWSSRREEV